MSGTVDQRLAAAAITLPAAAAPAANYVHYTRTGNLVFVSGQVPVQDGDIRFKGTVGADMDRDTAYQAARLCGLNLIAQVKAACDGDLDRVKRVVKLGSFVACTADFTDQPEVINGASDLMAEAFGAAGKHARFAVGALALPRGVAVEIDGIFEIE